MTMGPGLRDEWPFVRRFAVAAGLIVAFDGLIRVVAERVLPVGAHIDLGKQLAIHRVDHALGPGAVRDAGLTMLMVLVVLLALVPAFRDFGRTGVRAHVSLGVVAGGMLANLVSLTRTGFVLDFLAVRVGSTGYFSFVPADVAQWLGIAGFVVIIVAGLLHERCPARSKGEWSRHSDLNRGPAVYETAALPLSYVGVGRV